MNREYYMKSIWKSILQYEAYQSKSKLFIEKLCLMYCACNHIYYHPQ